MGHEQDHRNRIQYAIFKYQRTKDNSNLIASAAISQVKYHLEANGHNHLTKPIFIAQPAIAGVVNWLSKELQHAFKGEDFDSDTAIDELKNEINNSYNHSYVEPTLHVLEKAKSYF
ncbi:MAG: hypothetical protein HOP34_08835 [Methylococcaceae bacterium]|nr:hypothetical protein [Methylococcaceae bacterium]